MPHTFELDVFSSKKQYVVAAVKPVPVTVNTPVVFNGAAAGERLTMVSASAAVFKTGKIVRVRSMVTVAGFALPLKSPCQPTKIQPVAGCTDTRTCVPAL